MHLGLAPGTSSAKAYGRLGGRAEMAGLSLKGNRTPVNSSKPCRVIDTCSTIIEEVIEQQQEGSAF
jgi:hypothetical protein